MATTITNFTKVVSRLLIIRKQLTIFSPQTIQRRLFYILPTLRMREVLEKTKDKTTVIEGEKKESLRQKVLLKLDGPKDACPLCKLNMDIKYTDILIISQFVQEDGNIIPKSVTGLCNEQHQKMKKLIDQAHRAGKLSDESLMQSLRPNVYPEEYSQMSDFKWKKYNVYFTEAMDDY